MAPNMARTVTDGVLWKEIGTGVFSLQPSLGGNTLARRKEEPTLQRSCICARNAARLVRQPPTICGTGHAEDDNASDFPHSAVATTSHFPQFCPKSPFLSRQHHQTCYAMRRPAHEGISKDISGVSQSPLSLTQSAPSSVQQQMAPCLFHRPVSASPSSPPPGE